jgi:hypothetical protein
LHRQQLSPGPERLRRTRCRPPHREDALDELYSARHATLILAAAGLADEAFALLEPQLVGPSSTILCDLKYGWHFDPIHDDPPWLRFLESIGRSPDQLAAIKCEVRVPE